MGLTYGTMFITPNSGLLKEYLRHHLPQYDKTA